MAPDLVRDLRSHRVVVVAAAVLAAVSGLPLAAQAGWPVYGYAAAGMVVFAVASPHQSHARAVLHVAGRHGGAAVVSAATLGAQAVMLVGVAIVASAPALRPSVLGVVLLSTGLANAVGTVVALRLLRGVHRSPRTGTGVLTRIGFLGVEAVAQIGGYLAIIVVAAVLGPAAVAALEAARVAASPVQILVVGLLSTLLPPLVSAVASRDRPAFQRSWRRANAVVVVFGGVYVAVLLLFGRVVAALLGRHVDVVLAATRAGISTIEATGAPAMTALMAEQRLGRLNILSGVANALTLAILPLTLTLLGPIGMLVAQGTGSAVRVAGASVLARRLVAERTPAGR